MNIERQLFLRTMIVGRSMGSAAEHLAGLMRDAYFPAGSILYRAGEASDRLYFIVRGQVQLVSEGLEPLRFGDRSVIGVLDMLQDRPYARTAVAMADVEALETRAEDWLEMLEDNFEYGRAALGGNATGLTALAQALPLMGFPPAGVPGQQLSLPGAVGEPLDLVGRLLVLRALPAFSMARIQALSTMSEIAEELRLRPGAALFGPGQVPTSVYAVARGKVEIWADSFPSPVTFGPGTVVGNYAPFSDRVLPFGARAAEPTTVLRIGKEDLLDLMEIHFEVARSAMAYVANERVRMLELRADLSAGSPASLSNVGQVVPLPVGA